MCNLAYICKFLIKHELIVHSYTPIYLNDGAFIDRVLNVFDIFFN